MSIQTQHKTELNPSTLRRTVAGSILMRGHSKEKEAAHPPPWSTKDHSLVLQKWWWLQAPHNIEPTQQDQDTPCKRCAGFAGPSQKTSLSTLKLNTYMAQFHGQQLRKSKVWLSPRPGKPVPAELTPRHFPPGTPAAEHWPASVSTT